MATRLVLLDVIERAERAATGLRAADAAAKALEDVMRQGTARAIGADLRLSGFRGGPPTFKPERSKGHAALTIGGGTYALADAGRAAGGDRRIRSKRRRLSGTKRRPALRTPHGPRRSIKSGKGWTGFAITETWSPKALDEATEAARAVILADFAKVGS